MNPDHAAFLTPAALRTKRAEVEAAVADLIDLLDALDAATEDLEEDDAPGDAQQAVSGGRPVASYAEADAEDGGDDELSLGAPERHPSALGASWGPRVDRSTHARQTDWAAGLNIASRDEGEVDDEPEDGGDDEPSLGAVNLSTAAIVDTATGAQFTEGLDQTGWGTSSTNDGEAGDDNGLGDRDGYEEQHHLEHNRPVAYVPCDVRMRNREVDKDVAWQALDKVEAIRRRKSGACASVARQSARDDLVFIEPGAFMWPSRGRIYGRGERV